MIDATWEVVKHRCVMWQFLLCNRDPNKMFKIHIHQEIVQNVHFKKRLREWTYVCLNELLNWTSLINQLDCKVGVCKKAKLMQMCLIYSKIRCKIPFKAQQFPPPPPNSLRQKLILLFKTVVGGDDIHRHSSDLVAQRILFLHVSPHC